MLVKPLYLGPVYKTVPGYLTNLSKANLMNITSNLMRFFKCYLLIICLITVFSSCKKGDPLKPGAELTVTNADYQWGDLAINKKAESDVIRYNASGNIDSVFTYDANKKLLRSVAFTYDGNKITLNSDLKDQYELDNAGRVIYHSTAGVQHGNNIVSIERFTYDADGYLNKVTMSSNFDSYVGPVFSVINYEVKNGNYVKFALSNVDSGTVTRQYDFSYNTSKTVNSPCSFFAPIFANDTYSNIDKYLNYGRASQNLLTGVGYYITNLDKTVTKGSFNVVTKLNSDNYISELDLVGNNLTSFPSDNISPLPRSIKFAFK